VREARGDASGAEEVFARSLAIREELAARVGTPQASRDLSVALNNVGRVREARGDASGAREALHRAALLLNGLVDAGTIEAGDEARLADIQHRLSRLSA